MKDKPVVRPATAEDLEIYYPGTIRPTIKAWLGEIDGEILAVGGFAFSEGRWFAFFDIRPGVRETLRTSRAYKKTLVRAAKMIMGEAERQGIKYIYADTEKHESGAGRWLESLGFIPDPRTLYLYRWGR